jgi:hypothetical protein
MNQFDRDPGIVPEAPPADAPPEPARPGPFHHTASSAGYAIIF